MIIKEIEIINGEEHILTYSDNNKYILQKQTGNLYVSALDLPMANFEYEETDIEVEPED